MWPKMGTVEKQRGACFGVLQYLPLMWKAEAFHLQWCQRVIKLKSSLDERLSPVFCCWVFFCLFLEK